MQIKDVVFYVIPAASRNRTVESRRASMEPVPPGINGLYTHTHGLRGADAAKVWRSDAPCAYFELVIRVVTDGSLDAYTTYNQGYSVAELEAEARQFLFDYAPLIIGLDVFDRELVWQKLWYAQRFFYSGRRLVDQVDNMLWDLASRHARLPIYKLLGGFRERVPAYANIGGATVDDLVTSAMDARAQGFIGGKDHSYRGVKENTEMARRLREAMGDDFLLFHDPVESYTYDDAVKVGRALEKYNYTWIEEPLQDYDILGLKKLCAALDLPVLTLEWIGAIGGQPYNTAPYLAFGAADIVRQRGVGITGQLKQAAIAESFGVEVHGGDHQIILSTHNDPFFEAYMGLRPRPDEDELDCRGTLVVEDGYMSVAWLDRPAVEPDWDEIGRTAVTSLTSN
jgi:L-alanine-DL-glutamate epimerase-like enolase superfamily enzyme